jgi:exonuclease III
MKILFWNMNYWKNTNGDFQNIIEWKNKCIDFLKKEECIDFYILQEINPIKLFEKNHNQYEFSMTNYNILYHELTNELLFDGRKDNFWGNAILFHENYKLEKNNMGTDNKYYYGRNSIMCYDFISQNKETITIINFYNKINYANKGRYTMLDDFENDQDIRTILKSRNKKIILVGDFNTGFGEKDEGQYNKFIDSYNKKYSLKNCIKNYSDKFIPTYYHTNNFGYVNDFAFCSRFNSINVFDQKDGWETVGDINLWKGFSDHRPFIIELK